MRAGERLLSDGPHALLHVEYKLTGEGSAVTAAQVTRAEVLGSMLRERIHPSGAARRPRRTAAQRDAENVRDRLWTVLVERYATIERAGGTLWGRQMPDHVPTLQGRYVPRRRAKVAVPPAPPTG